MLKTYLYIQDDLKKKIDRVAKEEKMSKAETMREALGVGIGIMIHRTNASAEALLKLAEIGKKYRVKGPKDLSANMDKYLWDDYEV